MEESPLDAVDPRAVTWSIRTEVATTREEDESRIRFTQRLHFAAESQDSSGQPTAKGLRAPDKPDAPDQPTEPAEPLGQDETTEVGGHIKRFFVARTMRAKFMVTQARELIRQSPELAGSSILLILRLPPTENQI